MMMPRMTMPHARNGNQDSGCYGLSSRATNEKIKSISSSCIDEADTDPLAKVQYQEKITSRYNEGDISFAHLRTLRATNARVSLRCRVCDEQADADPLANVQYQEKTTSRYSEGNFSFARVVNAEMQLSEMVRQIRDQERQDKELEQERQDKALEQETKTYTAAPQSTSIHHANTLTATEECENSTKTFERSRSRGNDRKLLKQVSIKLRESRGAKRLPSFVPPNVQNSRFGRAIAAREVQRQGSCRDCTSNAKSLSSTLKPEVNKTSDQLAEEIARRMSKDDELVMELERSLRESRLNNALNESSPTSLAWREEFTTSYPTKKLQDQERRHTSYFSHGIAFRSNHAAVA